MPLSFEGHAKGTNLYTKAQRERRDATKWTVVQGILAPVQFVVFLVSLWFVLRYMITGDGYAVASMSIVIKTLVLYTIMITGAIWEKTVFGQYLFARAFFWEDVVSFVVIVLHTLYLLLFFSGLVNSFSLMVVALLAYFVYVINAFQFLWKLRLARHERPLEVRHV